jgi:dimethylglycine dehydrogenase
MEHQYFVTEPIPAIAEAGHRMPLLRCPISDYYSRQEKGGLLSASTSRTAGPGAWTGSPRFFQRPLPDDLDRVMDVLEGRVRADAAL